MPVVTNSRIDPHLKQAYECRIRRTAPPEDQHMCIICQETWGQEDDIIIGENCRQHVFHYDCLLNWLACQPGDRKSCPLCRSLVVTVCSEGRWTAWDAWRGRQELIDFLIESWVCFALTHTDIFVSTGSNSLSDRILHVIDFVTERHRAAVVANDEGILSELDVHPSCSSYPVFSDLLRQSDFWQLGSFSDESTIRIAVVDCLLKLAGGNLTLDREHLFQHIRGPFRNVPEGAPWREIRNIPFIPSDAYNARLHAGGMMNYMTPSRFLEMVDLRKQLYEASIRGGNLGQTIYRSSRAGVSFTIVVDLVFSRNPVPFTSRLVERDQHGAVTKRDDDPAWNPRFAWDYGYGPSPASEPETEPRLMLENQSINRPRTSEENEEESEFEISACFPWEYFLSGGKVEFEETWKEGTIRFVAPGGETAEFTFDLARDLDFA